MNSINPSNPASFITNFHTYEKRRQLPIHYSDVQGPKTITENKGLRDKAMVAYHDAAKEKLLRIYP